MNAGSNAILSTKRGVLSSGGTAYNDLYYNVLNSSVSLLECTFEYMQIISLPSLQFGSTSQINIPNDNFIGDVILHLVLPNTSSNQTICRGWGYAILQNIAYTMGSSNSTQIMLQGDSILQTILSQSFDPVQRDEIMRLAGQEYLGVPVTPAGEDAPINECFLVLPLPFSSLCSKLPVDTTMLQNNISIQIQFNSNARLIYGGSDTPPTSFLRAEVILRQGKLSDQSKSVRAEMIMNPSLQYSYNICHAQNFVTQQFAGVRASDGVGVQVDLNTFLNADLTAIMFYVVKNTDKLSGSTDSPNPFNMDNIYNIQLQFAGQTLMNYPGYTHRLANMLSGEYQSASYVPYSVISAGAVSPFVSVPKNCYPVIFDFARERATCNFSHFFNTFRLTNQTLRLQFNTQFGPSVTYKCYCTFFYNGIIDFKNGTSSVYID